jgi:hypothetical protein
MKKAIVALMLLAVCAGANADVVTFSGATQTADTMVASATPMTGSYKFGGNTANYGGSTWFGTNAGGSNTKAILRFDVSSLAGSFASINSVTLRLYQRDTSTANVTLFQMNPADSNWEEGTDTGSYSNGWWNRTSWSYCNRGCSDAWSGGAGVGSWGAALASTAGMPGVLDSAVDFTFTGVDLDALITAWASVGVSDYGRMSFAAPDSNNVVANEGIVLLAGANSTFYSTENGTMIPELIVNFNPVPEPATMGLLAVGGVVALIRRKK